MTPPDPAQPLDIPARPFRPWLLLAIVALSVCLCYCMIFRDPFVLDSKFQMETNPVIRGTLPLWQLVHDPRPVTTFTFAMNFVVTGMKTWSYHLVNIVIQIANAALLFTLVRLTILHSPRLGGDRLAARTSAEGPAGSKGPGVNAPWGSMDHLRLNADFFAFAAALFWAVHPVCVQVVTYTIQRGESLMAMFFLLCLMAGHFAARAQKQKVRIAWHLAMIVAMVLSVLSKEVGVTALIVAFLYESAFFTGSFTQTFRRNSGSIIVLLVLGAIAAAVLLPALFRSTNSAGFELKNVTLLQYFVTQPAAILHYLYVSLFPLSLSIDVFWQPATRLEIIIPSFVLLLAMVGAGCVLLWKNPPVGFLILTFFGILVPTSSILPILDLCVEHRVYLSLAALSTLVVLAGYRMIGRLDDRVPVRVQNGVAIGLVLALATVLGVRTTIRNFDYRSNEALWRATIATNPDNPRAYYALAGVLGDQHRLEPAMELLKKTLEIQPRNPETLRAMGAMLLDSNRFDEAMPYLNMALGLKAAIPREQALHEAILHLYLGRAHDHQKEPDLARQEFDASIAAKPDFADAFAYRGDFRMAHGEIEAGLGDLRAAAKLAPDSSLIRNKLGVALAKLNRAAEARSEFFAAYAADPNDAETCTNLGRLLQNQRDVRCVEFYERAFALKPDSAQSMQDMAWVLSVGPIEARHDPLRALDLAQKANQQLKFNSVRALEILVDAQLSNNQAADAIATLKAGLKLAQSQGLSNKAAQFEKALELLQKSPPPPAQP